MNNIPYVRYNPAAALSGGAELSLLAELAHRRMCDVLWSRGETLPHDDASLARLCRVSARVWRNVKRELLQHGWRVRRNRWTHPEAMRLLRLTEAMHAAASARGILGNKVRWGGKPAIAKGSRPAMAQGSQPAIAKGSLLNGKTLNVKKEEPILSVNDDERSSLNAQDAGKGSDKETRFMADVASVIAAWSPKEGVEELSQWGGWWRNRFRENAPKSQKVLAEIKGLILEHRVRRSPGAAAMDLWKRLP